MCRSTCFGHLHAHHQEFTTALTASGFTLECDGSSVVGHGLTGLSSFLEGVNVVSHLYKYCIILLIFVLCSCCEMFLWRYRHRVNSTLVTCVIMYSNVGICYCLLIGVKGHH